MEAYYDAHCPDNDPETYTRRKLNWQAPVAVSMEDAARIMSRACPGGYNEFGGALLRALPPGSMVTLARAMSPAVFVKPEVPEANLAALKAKVKAEGCTNEGGVTRLWWD